MFPIDTIQLSSVELHTIVRAAAKNVWDNEGVEGVGGQRQWPMYLLGYLFPHPA